MGKTYDVIDEQLADFIGTQHVFFVATAPSAGGCVNLSPKGLDAFRILDARTVAYLDLTGSGVETIAHLRDNGRITIMFCAFDGAPKILRLYGRGEVYHLTNLPDFNGTYTSVGAGATVAGGFDVESMRNANGVEIKIVSTTRGVDLRAAVEGIKIDLKQ